MFRPAFPVKKHLSFRFYCILSSANCQFFIVKIWRNLPFSPRFRLFRGSIPVAGRFYAPIAAFFSVVTISDRFSIPLPLFFLFRIRNRSKQDEKGENRRQHLTIPRPLIIMVKSIGRCRLLLIHRISFIYQKPEEETEKNKFRLIAPSGGKNHEKKK